MPLDESPLFTRMQASANVLVIKTYAAIRASRFKNEQVAAEGGNTLGITASIHKNITCVAYADNADSLCLSTQ